MSFVLRASDGMFYHVVGEIAHSLLVAEGDLPEPIM